MLNLNYILENSGWAILEIGNGDKTIKIDISYLHDSLKNMAESAINLRNKFETSVIFMDEPGEHWLVLKKNKKNDIEYELRWYEHWASWNLLNEEKYEVKMDGITTLPKYINEVRKNLIQIFEQYGTEKYKEKWGEHEFPIQEYKQLK
ncbi:hypothetical protein [Elizabethkingia sp. JS20170427COW]|uniref:hypothetical protein n=1 Tax=Elizabethkingia sp. JS20170427COW TaxID=2583851 RepID=UPI00143DC6E4|nr:hypothetical protein [Elizabethkingia sp. JS20170427COW]